MWRLIFQYTDGVTEATNVENQLYGMERLEQVLNRVKDRIPSEILPEVKKDIDTFVGEAPQFDDITMLCVEYKVKMEKHDRAKRLNSGNEIISGIQPFLNMLWSKIYLVPKILSPASPSPGRYKRGRSVLCPDVLHRSAHPGAPHEVVSDLPERR